MEELSKNYFLAEIYKRKNKTLKLPFTELRRITGETVCCFVFKGRAGLRVHFGYVQTKGEDIYKCFCSSREISGLAMQYNWSLIREHHGSKRR